MFYFEKKPKVRFLSRAKRKICALIAVAILASGTVSIDRFNTTYAAPGEQYNTEMPMSKQDALEQAAALYEKISGQTIAVPQEMLADGAYTESSLKAVMLGCISMEQLAEYTDENTIVKQDFMSMLYSVMLKYRPELAISADEAEIILNDCLDNACVNEENRIAYAFMVKYGIVETNVLSEPNKEISWQGCADIVDSVYDRFNNDIYFYMGDTLIYMGDEIENVVELLGNPVRIDESEYGFEWYVFGTGAEDFAMIGVDNGLTCAFFTNSSSFKFGEYEAGETYDDLTLYSHIAGLQLLTNGDGSLDSVYYNRRTRETVSDEAAEAKSGELLSIINAYRQKHGQKSYVLNTEFSKDAEGKTKNYIDEIKARMTADRTAVSDGNEEELANADSSRSEMALLYEAAEEAGYPVDMTINFGEDIFEIYRQYISSQEGCELLHSESVLNGSIGISTTVNSDNTLIVSAIADSMKPAIAQDSKEEELDFEVETIEFKGAEAAPVITSPQASSFIENGEDIVISLEESTGTRYFVQLFNPESRQNDIYAYITTDENEIRIPADMLATGINYELTVGACTQDGDILTAEPITFTYGTATNPVSIIAPYNEGVTYDDFIELTWDSSSYYNFGIDVYNENNEMVVNTYVTNERTALIQNLDPGKYSLCITAFKRDESESMGQAWVDFEIIEPEPEITEIILEEDDEYYFVYESYDENTGEKYLYFYDEELVEYPEDDGTSTYKKKIIQKKIKATHNYEALAAVEPHPEKTDGKPYLTLGTTETGNRIVEEAYKYLGIDYVWGGTSPQTGFDCSGLTSYIMKTLGNSIERTAANQFASSGTFVNKSELIPGDFVYFQKNGVIHHVGIYIGNGQMIHAPRTGDVVKIESIEGNSYESSYAGAKRMY